MFGGSGDQVSHSERFRENNEKKMFKKKDPNTKRNEAPSHHNKKKERPTVTFRFVTGATSDGVTFEIVMAICFVFFYRVFLLGFANKKETAGDRREIGPFYRVFQPSFRGGGTSISSAQRQQCSSLVLASFLFVCVCVCDNKYFLPSFTA